MNASIQHPQYGKIDYYENIWTGKKQISINGQPLERQGKKELIFHFAGENKTCTLTGDFFRGAKLNVDTDRIQLTPSAKWYELTLSILIGVLIIAWGNSVALCSIIPIAGGAIGGLIGGLGIVINLSIIKPKDQLWQKLLISVCSLLVTFLAAHLILYPLMYILF